MLMYEYCWLNLVCQIPSNTIMLNGLQWKIISKKKEEQWDYLIMQALEGEAAFSYSKLLAATENVKCLFFMWK